jgi:acetyl-CoA carboxylase biotin carboxylase subunit
VLADTHGNVVHLGERDCTIQRRHQKLVEETPSPAVDDVLRARIGAIAVDAARAAGYRSAGTIEGLLTADGSYYFMEMNTRIQVEHSVTEMQTGIDLVKEQIRIAAGASLRYDPKEQQPVGHTIECRINAEDPERFTPCPGTISEYHAPGGPGIRVDSAAYAGWKVLPYYDSLVAKLLAHGNTREEAILRMLRALDEYRIVGIKTTIPLHQRVLRDLDFIQGRFSTQFLDGFLRK